MKNLPPTTTTTPCSNWTSHRFQGEERNRKRSQAQTHPQIEGMAKALKGPQSPTTMMVEGGKVTRAPAAAPPPLYILTLTNLHAQATTATSTTTELPRNGSRAVNNTDNTHLPNSSDFPSNTDNIGNPNIDNIARTSNTANADTNSSNSKSNANNATGIVDTSNTLNTNTDSNSNDAASIITVARTPSTSELRDTVNASTAVAPTSFALLPASPLRTMNQRTSAPASCLSTLASSPPARCASAGQARRAAPNASDGRGTLRLPLASRARHTRRSHLHRSQHVRRRNTRSCIDKTRDKILYIQSIPYQKDIEYRMAAVSFTVDSY